ncbi:glycoside hydrolase family 75 protein [Streptomyces tagetis]|uniref:Glycoside hydrolase family 75 protein n=1 Tax=Streptomyces tagetis TaxID=2820809 RepID=A0A940XE52_9ACTN|nr:glycoside hydrolase family 75 protein [Streptomyces sp. RG38]MBQ0826834.1 glycoside hydrolase family 75 protein [Streptomyces sp. RG38]
MRVHSLTLIAAGAALLAPTSVPGAFAAPRPGGPQPPHPTVAEAGPRPERDPLRPGRGGRQRPPVPRPGAAGPGPAARTPEPEQPREDEERAVTAADLLARVRACDPVSHGHYRSDAGRPADIPVCGTPEAVFWKADLDIDCDGRPGARCNLGTDPDFSPATAYSASDGGPLDAETLPYIVVPEPSGIWDHREHGVHGGSVAAVVHGDRVRYAVVGDIGPRDVIGEASYATAEGLGIPADPRSGGAASDVTYIVFKDSEVRPIEDRSAAEEAGEELARRFVAGG